MKKFISFLMAAVLCFGMTTAVMAAESPSVVVSAVDSSKFTVDTDVYSEYDDEAVKEILKAGGHTPNIIASVILEISRVDGSHDAANVQVYVNGCVMGEEWIAYAWNTTTNEWDPASAKVVKGGVIEIAMPHFSDVILVKTANAPVVTETETTSPKTADVAMFGLYAAVALAGTVTAARKAKASK